MFVFQNQSNHRWGVHNKVDMARHLIRRGEIFPHPEHLTNLISLEIEEAAPQADAKLEAAFNQQK